MRAGTRLLLVACLCILHAGCYHWQSVERSDWQLVFDRDKPDRVRVSALVVTEPKIEADSLRGRVPGEGRATLPVSIPLSSIDRLEVREQSVAGTLLAVFAGTAVGLALILMAACSAGCGN